MKKIALVFGLSGVGMAAVGLSSIDERQAARDYQNPLAIEQSGYGMTLARLSQDLIDSVWHMGQQHDDHEHAHDHDHNHDHLFSALDHDEPGHSHGGHDHHHDHGDHSHSHSEHDHHHDDHTHDHVSLAADESHGSEGKAGTKIEDCSDPDCNPATVGCSAGDDCKFCSPKTATLAETSGFLERGIDYIRGLESSHYKRTNKFGANEALKAHVAHDVEKRFLQAYRMDPTNYGVYNGYFLFLTIHDLGGTPQKREHARKISELTIGAAAREDTSPGPWVTAAAAALNQFFLDSEDARIEGRQLSEEMLTAYDQKIGYCLQEYERRRMRAERSGRWEQISQDRRDDMEEQADFVRGTRKQFGAMLARLDQEKSGNLVPGLVDQLKERVESTEATATTEDGELD